MDQFPDGYYETPLLKFIVNDHRVVFLDIFDNFEGFGVDIIDHIELFENAYAGADSEVIEQAIMNVMDDGTLDALKWFGRRGLITQEAISGPQDLETVKYLLSVGIPLYIINPLNVLIRDPRQETLEFYLQQGVTFAHDGEYLYYEAVNTPEMYNLIPLFYKYGIIKFGEREEKIIVDKIVNNHNLKLFDIYQQLPFNYAMLEKALEKEVDIYDTDKYVSFLAHIMRKGVNISRIYQDHYSGDDYYHQAYVYSYLMRT